MDKLLKLLYRIVRGKQAEGEIDFSFDRRWVVFFVCLLVVVGAFVWATTRIRSVYVWALVLLLGAMVFIGLARAKRSGGDGK